MTDQNNSMKLGENSTKKNFDTKYYNSGQYPSSCFYLKHHPAYILKHMMFRRRSCLRFQLKLTELSPVDRVSPYFRTNFPSAKTVKFYHCQKHRQCYISSVCYMELTPQQTKDTQRVLRYAYQNIDLIL